MPIISTINNELIQSKVKEPAKKPVEKSRKAKKALQQHMQTVALLQSSKDEPGPSSSST